MCICRPKDRTGVIADLDATTIEHYAVEIGIEIVANSNVTAKLAPEGGLEMDLIADSSQELPEQGCSGI